MRTRALIVLVVVAVAAAVGAVYRVRTAGHAEVRAITERVAAAMAAGDRAALAAEPALQGRPESADWLAARGPVLADGYRVSVRRNGADGYRLMSLDDVSHLGVIESPHGTVSLGFWCDPTSGELAFVTASGSSRGSAEGTGPGGGQIRVGN